VSLRDDDFLLLPLPEVDSRFVDQFDCGTDSLNDFLRNDALTFHNERLGFTTCVFHQDFPELVAYYTLANDSIQLSPTEIGDLGVNTATPPKLVPCVKLGKFAVHRDVQGQGNGKTIMRLIVDDILASNSHSAARILVLDSLYNQTGFYERCRFSASTHAANRSNGRRGSTVKMFLDIITAEFT